MKVTTSELDNNYSMLWFKFDNTKSHAMTFTNAMDVKTIVAALRHLASNIEGDHDLR